MYIKNFKLYSMSFDLLNTIIGFLVLVYSVILHEVAHGFVAERLGDPTARNAGRLTLNPIPHIDPMMTLILPAILYISSRFLGGGIILGAAKPVPVNPLYFDDPKKDMALVSMAGVATNFSLAICGALIFNLMPGYIPVLAEALQSLVFINILLGVFNLIPIPPLDGSKVLASVLPRNAAAALLSLEPFGFFLIIGLLMFSGLGTLLYGAIAALMAILQVPLY